MPTFILRNQGFFYTDEYYAPGEVFKQVVKRTFETRAAAEQELAALVRRWVRSEPIGNYVFDDNAAVNAVFAYLRQEWPDTFAKHEWLFDAEIPDDATDEQVDEIVKRMGVTFAEVFEVDESSAKRTKREDYEDELHFGPTDDETDDEADDDDDADDADDDEDNEDDEGDD